MSQIYTPASYDTYKTYAKNIKLRCQKTKFQRFEMKHLITEGLYF